MMNLRREIEELLDVETRTAYWCSCKLDAQVPPSEIISLPNLDRTKADEDLESFRKMAIRGRHQNGDEAITWR